VEALEERIGALYAAKRYREAVPLAEQVIELERQARGLDTPELAQSWANLGGLLWFDRDLPAATRAHEQALAAWQRVHGAVHAEVAGTLESLARLHRDQHHQAEAERFYLRALETREELLGPKDPRLSTTVNGLAKLYNRVGRHADALPLYERALRLREGAAKPNPVRVAEAVNNLAEGAKDAGDYDRALALHRRALELKERALGESHPKVALSLNNLAVINDTLGRHEVAEPLYLRAVSIKEARFGRGHGEVASALNNLALHYRGRGDYLRAEPLYVRSLAIREKVHGARHPRVALARANLADLLVARGDLDRAQPLYEQSLEILEEKLGGAAPLVASMLNNLAALQRQRGDLRSAEPRYARALAIREAALGRDHADVAISLNNLAELHLAAGRPEQAAPLLERALAIWRAALGGDHPRVASGLVVLARVHEASGRPAEAERLLARALSIEETALGAHHPRLAGTLGALAGLRGARGDEAGAEQLLRRAVAVEERHLASVLSVGTEVERRLFARSLAATADRVLSLAARSRRPGAARLAALVVLQRKGRTLDAMRSGWDALRQGLDADGTRMLDELRAGRARFAQLTLHPSAGLPAAAGLAERRELAARLEKLEADLSRRSATFSASAAPVTLAAVAARIPQGAWFVGYSVYRPLEAGAAARYLAFALDRSGRIGWADLGPQRDVDAAVAALRESLVAVRPDVVSLGRRAWDLLLGPVAATVGRSQSLLVSPDGTLNLLPFSALVRPDGRYLVEAVDLRHVTSGRDLLRRAPPQSREPPLLLADVAFDAEQSAESGASARRSADMAELRFGPLPGTRAEAEAIRTALGLAAERVRLGAHATEGHLVAAAGPSILHVATHGFFLPAQALSAAADQQLSAVELRRLDNPLLRSGLALAGFNTRAQVAGSADGVLTALEVADLDLRGTQLVVLSACETGLGELDAGEGVYGLKRALVMAGAATQVVSLWKVADLATEALMSAYYRRLVAGEDRVAALRQVQLALLRGTLSGSGDEPDRGALSPGRKPAATAGPLAGWRHPYYWASFVVSGAAGPVDP